VNKWPSKDNTTNLEDTITLELKYVAGFILLLLLTLRLSGELQSVKKPDKLQFAVLLYNELSSL